MLLRTSISHTKKFFQRTLENFKSFFSGGYQKLPKSPPFNPFSCNTRDIDMNISQSYRELDMFYTDFTNRWDTENRKTKKTRSKKKTIPTMVLSSKHEDNFGRDYLTKYPNAVPEMNCQAEEREDQEKKKIVLEAKRKKDLSSNSIRVRKEMTCNLVTEKLKEMEMMDKSNVDYVLDIEEVLHYYSRLTCPAYIDIVDKFFMDMYTELFSRQSEAKDQGNKNSRQRLRAVQYL